MLHNENIICISSIDWDFLWQQHQAIMSSFAENGNRVLFIENTGVRAPRLSDLPRIKKRLVKWLHAVKGFKEEGKNLYVYSPLILPFPYSKFARIVNRFLLLKALKRWIKTVNFYNPIIWTFLPTPIALDLIEHIPHKALVYYCTDNFYATSKSARKILRYEKLVIRKADAVFAMSTDMYEYCLKYNKNVTRIPIGVNPEIFLDSWLDTQMPREMQGITGRKIGYVGGVRRSIDLDLVIYLAEKLSDFTFIFIGPIQTGISNLKHIKNIIFFGEKKHQDLPAYIRHFDVCIIPYLKDDYTDNVSPAKLNEYLLMGKPVVSVNLREVEEFNKDNGRIVYIADTYADFVHMIRSAIDHDNEVLRNKRKNAALNNSWDKKINQMSLILESILDKKEGLDWKMQFLKAYFNLRRKLIYPLGIASILWLLAFYTPLIWFFAAPLKISQEPQKSDAVVVFAGGVGESGEAGQGFEERVKYAVSLYKNGYAGKIIFSSGYAYVFKEPFVMKVLAISLGVSEKDITLEDKACNTYENIKFVKEILEKNGWSHILLVTSPYHMRRSLLVFNKITKNISVVCTPIPNSLFYSHPDKDIEGKRIWKRINLKQIKGILHEYLGILYYWCRKWI